jgi:hypothetical protein
MYFRTLFEPRSQVEKCPTNVHHQLAMHVRVLWAPFLKNVHPVVKIFFDWEVEPVIRRASAKPAEMTLEELALVLSINFVALLSLAEEDCATLFHCEKVQLLDNCQEAVEAVVLRAGLLTTIDRLVLQAFTLYLVSPCYYL